MSKEVPRAGRDRAAAVPDGFYEPPPVVELPEDGGAPVVRFTGEDGRERAFRFEELPLSGLHRDFAHALGVRIGPSGGRRTQRAASSQWQTVKRFLLLLDGLAEPPRRVQELRVRHLERYLMSRRQTCGEKSARRNLQDLLRIVRVLPGQDRLDGAVADYAGQPGHGMDAQQAARPGYSDREFQAIMAAARSDVAAIRDRIMAGERLLGRFLAGDETMSVAEREQGARLEAMAATGRVQVDYRGLTVGEYPAACYAQARQLFVIDPDLAPLLIYAAGLSGRNPETLKELPAKHRLLEERAVAVTLTKRRRGKANSRTTVHWSVDGERELRTMGGFYLLLHRMMARSRAFSGTGSVWSIWAGNGRGGVLNAATGGHIGPFDAELARKLKLGAWAGRHGLVGDDGKPLEMMVTRIKKTVEVRTAKQVGGHLPSARVTNTADTSFTHYLRTDPFVAEWAADVLTEAITDAEENARAVVVRLGGGSVAAVPERVREQAAAGELDTLASACTDIEHRQREALLVECRARKIEPPGRTRVEKVLVAARGKWEKTFCACTIGRLGEAGTARLLSLVAEDNEAGTTLLAALKRDPAAVGLDSLLTEITKLNDVRKLGLPDGLFTDCSEKLVAAWRARAIKMYPSDFRDTSEDVRITLLAALCSSRQAEITDALVDLLVALVHKINARAERRVEKQLTAELKKVRGKEGILFKLATAAVDKPDEVVRRALFPVVGEKTLKDLVAEAKANEKVFKAKVRTTLRSSYSSYYRQMLPPLLNTLGFKCNNTAYRPVMDAVKLLKKYADVDGKTRFYDSVEDKPPMDGVVRKDWREAVVDDKGKVERIPYELCVLVALRDAVRRREIYVEGAARWRNPEDDLPGDFEATRAVHYAAIRQPLNPGAFIADLKERMTEGLDQLSGALADGSAGGVKVTTRKGEPWITVPKLEPLAEPTPSGAQGGGRAPLGRPGPPGRAEECRLPHRVHRGVLLGGRLRAHRA